MQCLYILRSFHYFCYATDKYSVTVLCSKPVTSDSNPIECRNGTNFIGAIFNSGNSIVKSHRTLNIFVLCFLLIYMFDVHILLVRFSSKVEVTVAILSLSLYWVSNRFSSLICRHLFIVANTVIVAVSHRTLIFTLQTFTIYSPSFPFNGIASVLLEKTWCFQTNAQNIFAGQTKAVSRSYLHWPK